MAESCAWSGQGGIRRGGVQNVDCRIVCLVKSRRQQEGGKGGVGDGGGVRSLMTISHVWSNKGVITGGVGTGGSRGQIVNGRIVRCSRVLFTGDGGETSI